MCGEGGGSQAAGFGLAGSQVLKSAAFLARLARHNDPILADDVGVDVDRFGPKAFARLTAETERVEPMAPQASLAWCERYAMPRESLPNPLGKDCSNCLVADSAGGWEDPARSVGDGAPFCWPPSRVAEGGENPPEVKTWVGRVCAGRN
jgi:hypothetical protein